MSSRRFVAIERAGNGLENIERAINLAYDPAAASPLRRSQNNMKLYKYLLIYNNINIKKLDTSAAGISTEIPSD